MRTCLQPLVQQVVVILVFWEFFICEPIYFFSILSKSITTLSMFLPRLQDLMWLRSCRFHLDVFLKKGSKKPLGYFWFCFQEKCGLKIQHSPHLPIPLPHLTSCYCFNIHWPVTLVSPFWYLFRWVLGLLTVVFDLRIKSTHLIEVLYM